MKLDNQTQLNPHRGRTTHSLTASGHPTPTLIRHSRTQPPPQRPPPMSPLLPNGNQLSLQPSAFIPLAQLLEVLGLQSATRAGTIRPILVHDNRPLDIGQVRPRIYCTQSHEGGKQQEDQALAGRALVSRVDAVYDEDRHDAAYLAGCGGDAVAGTSVAGWEDFGGDDKREGVGAW